MNLRPQRQPSAQSTRFTCGRTNSLATTQTRRIFIRPETISYLKTQSSIVTRKSSLVLGAGGSARAVVYALLNDGWNVTLAARRIEQAEALARSFFASHFSLATCQLNGFPLSTFHLLVNTTPLGMTPDIDSSPLPEGTVLTQGTIVYDLVYNPRETKLVRDAKVQGCHAVTGLGMLIEQAALSFELWTGHNPPRDVLYASVVE
jgi:shikimate dehydrogenase